MSNTDGLMRALLASIIAYPKSVLGLFLLCTGVLGWQARHFEINASADTLLTKDNKQYLQTQLVNRRFAPQEFLLVAYQPKDRPVLSQSTFNDLRAISEQLRQLERVESVRSILNVPLFSQADDVLSEQVDPSEWTLAKRNYSTSQLKKIFDHHPIYEDLLINQAQTATAIQVLFKSNRQLRKIQNRIIDLQHKSLNGELSVEEQHELEQLTRQAEPMERRLDRVRAAEIQAIRRILADYEEDANLYLGGVHVLGYQLIQIIKNDLVVFGSAIAAMICLVLYLLFRMLRWVVITLVCCACSVLSTMGLFGMLGFKATVISANFIALQLILTLAIVIHLIVQYREYSADHSDWNQVQLVKQTLFRKADPCFYAGITTSVGFASLLFSNIQPVITFGWMMVIAVFVSIAASLVLFPAMMAVCRREPAVARRSFYRHILSFFKASSLRHAGWVSAASFCLLAASIAGLVWLDVENSFLNYFRESTRVHKEMSFIDRQFGGTTPLDIVYTIPRAERKKDLVMTAGTVQRLQRLHKELEQHKAVGKVLSIVNFTELAKQANNGKPLTEYELTALYWTMEGSLREDLLGSFFSPEHNQARISVRIQDTTEGLDRAELITAIRQSMAELGIPDDQRQLTNLFVLYQDILQRLFQSQILTLGLVYAALTLTFLVIFRSFKIALIGIAPNILSTLMVLGLMGWLGIPLDLMTITIAAIAMGIAVDDTIHYTHRYREELREGSDDNAAAQAVERSHFSVGYALLYTSLIIILGFSLLIFSDFVPSILFGLLTGFAMVVALIANLSLLPVLLRRFVRQP